MTAHPAYETQIEVEDPLPRRGFTPGDVVTIQVDPFGLCGRDPHPPVTTERGPDGRFRTHSPVRIGVVARIDRQGTNAEWENFLPGASPYEAAPPIYYEVATNVGFYVFADYELTPTRLGNLDNLPEPHNQPEERV